MLIHGQKSVVAEHCGVKFMPFNVTSHDYPSEEAKRKYQHQHDKDTHERTKIQNPAYMDAHTDTMYRKSTFGTEGATLAVNSVNLNVYVLVIFYFLAYGLPCIGCLWGIFKCRTHFFCDLPPFM